MTAQTTSHFVHPRAHPGVRRYTGSLTATRPPVLHSFYNRLVIPSRIICFAIGGHLLAGCSDPVADAEQRLAIVEKTGASRSELCGAKRAVQAANLAAKREAGYKQAKLFADIDCNLADLNPAEMVDGNGQPIYLGETRAIGSRPAAELVEDNGEAGRDNWMGE